MHDSFLNRFWVLQILDSGISEWVQRSWKSSIFYGSEMVGDLGRWIAMVGGSQ